MLLVPARRDLRRFVCVKLPHCCKAAWNRDFPYFLSSLCASADSLRAAWFGVCHCNNHGRRLARSGALAAPRLGRLARADLRGSWAALRGGEAQHRGVSPCYFSTQLERTFNQQELPVATVFRFDFIPAIIA